MKDFQEFKKTIDKSVLEKWSAEIHDELIPLVDEKCKDDPYAWNIMYTQSHALRTSMRLLEAYHAWLSE